MIPLDQSPMYVPYWMQTVDKFHNLISASRQPPTTLTKSQACNGLNVANLVLDRVKYCCPPLPVELPY